MSKVDLRTLESVTGNDAAATALLNANFEEISEALDNAISRDGTAPNYMDANLDMNNKRLINLADPENDYDAINKKYFTDTIGNAASYASQAATSAAAAASSAQSSATSAAQAIAELQAAEATIQEAADRAIEEVEGRAEAELEDFVEETVKPDLQDMVNDASSYATAASGSATLAERWATSTTVVADGKYGSLYYAQQADSANTDAQSAKTDAQSARNTAQTAASNANVWAEGTDEQVQALGGVHSSKVWSTFGKFYVGQIVESPLPLIDATVHLLDGSLILGGGIYDDFVTYIADLYAEDPTANYWTTEAAWQQSVTNYGVCGKFVYDSVNNTVRLPKITGIVEGTTDLTALGDLVEAGCPNITGGWKDQNGGNGAVPKTGAFSGSVGSTGSNGWGTSAGSVSTIDFNASNSNPIYGNSDTVQPQTIKVLYYIVVATATKTEIEVDIDQITVDLANKADKDLANITPTQDVKSEITSWGMPSGTYIDITMPPAATNTTYTAPANGYISLRVRLASVNSSIVINSQADGSGMRVADFSVASNTQCGVVMPVKAGQTVSVYVHDYSSNTANNNFRFYYAEGEI